MSFRVYRDRVKAKVIAALDEIGAPRVEFEPQEPPRPEFGDIYVNVAFSLAKALKKSPYEIAKMLAEKIGSVDSLSCEPYQPGYINFRINYPELAFTTLARETAFPNLGRGEKVLVEHTSVNPNKALHIGHARNVFLGDSIARILRSTGYKVSVLNYVDDSGLQVADIIVGLLHLGFDVEPQKQEKYDHYAGDTIYVQVNELYEKNPKLQEKRGEVLKEIEERNSKTAKFAAEITERILKEQLKTCWRVGAYYDCLVFESHILATKMWDSFFKMLKGKNIAKYAESGELAGCWIAITKEGEEDTEKVLVRSNGTATYIAKDIPFAAWKLGLTDDRFGYKIFLKQPNGQKLYATTLVGNEKHPEFWDAKKAITVIDVRQKRLQDIISAILAELAGSKIVSGYIHLGYEVVTLSKNTVAELGIEAEKKFLQMSGRKGIYINLDNALDALRKKALAETKNRNEDQSKEWLEDVAEKIAIAAIRYELLKQDLDKIIVFDLQESLNLIGETGPYLQYSYARASRILEKASFEAEITEKSAAMLDKEWEIALVKTLAKFDMKVEEASVNVAPKVLARYAFQISSLFNSFYEKSPVISEANEEVKKARLALVSMFRNTLGRTAELLGIETPSRI
ncbi:MAG: arginine--tRNA ligase [Thaumarchaeota archaeon]|nr:arginine--tRNA ligase [Nitrososphaerota archaeon]